ncbi:hypothetical protein QQS21_012815 [Conoideocrella luteorostrata]|uniref:Cytochrome b561 domain-containing protein n=1 Tax=Conoideocrella luteorostrata TaxID=1105319 RepID=A0AAJ0CAH4_9HYPO|nr:hypothetical protein QQS21_012815 [Conoideocrella luteorostrata]
MASATGLPQDVPDSAATERRAETEPLLGKPGDAILAEGASIMQNFVLGTGILAQLGVIVLVANIWANIFMKPVILFSGHPIAMSTGVFILVQSILSLQPTETPRQKRVGQLIHASLNLCAFAALVTGTVIIEVNKVRSNGPHFHSTHAYLGVFTLLLMVGQYAVGFTMWMTPALYGGVDKAKSLYKYHRYTGYLTLLLLLVTVCLAMETEYVEYVLRINIWGVILPCVGIVIGVFPRIQKHKMGFAVMRRTAVDGV